MSPKSTEDRHVVKHRLFAYLVERPHPTTPDLVIRLDRTASFGEVVTSESAPEDPDKREPGVHYDAWPGSIARGKQLGSFFTDDELKSVEQRRAEFLRLSSEEQARAMATGPQGERAFLGGFPLPPHLQNVSNAVLDIAGSGDEEGGGTQINVSEMSVDELANYIREQKPNVDDTVQLAGNDPETAHKVLEAENKATGNDARAGVEKGLQTVIERGSQ